jgi:hypothetical protein
MKLCQERPGPWIRTTLPMRPAKGIQRPSLTPSGFASWRGCSPEASVAIQWTPNVWQERTRPLAREP